MAEQNDVYNQERCLEISIEKGDPLKVSEANESLGDAYFVQREYDKAIEAHEKSLEIAKDKGCCRGIIHSSLELGMNYIQVSKYDKAIGHFEKLLEIGRESDDSLLIMKSEVGLGRCYLIKGDFREAIKHWDNVLRIATTNENDTARAISTDNLGVAYLHLSQFQKAIDCLNKSLEINKYIGNKSGIASNNGNLGNAYRLLGKHNEAIKFLKTGLKISIKIRDKSGEASSNGNLGIAYSSLGKYKKGIKYYKKGLKISTEIKNQLEISNISGNLSNAYRCRGKYKKAIEYQEQSLKISTAIGNKSAIAANFGNLGDLYFRFRQYEKAIQYYEESLNISNEIGEESTTAIINGNLGYIYRCSGEYSNALSKLKISIQLFDGMFLNTVPDENKLSFTKEYFRCHIISMTCFLSLQNPQAALLVVDLGRAKELHFCIQKHGEDFKRGVLQYANSVWNRIDAKQEIQELKELDIILQNEAGCTTVLFFAFDLDRILNIWVLNKNVIHKKADFSLEDLNSLIICLLGKFNVRLGRDCTFFNLSIPCNANESTRFPFFLPNISRTNENAADFNRNLVDHAILQQIFQLLIDPVNDLIDGNKLIIVPDEWLFFTPFSSLIDGKGCYLSHSHSIQITPSLHSLRVSMEKHYDPNLGIALFVGNPTVGEQYKLPSAAEEVRCLSKLFQATPVLERKAQKQVVLDLLDKASIIHIAAHGEPRSGEILLAPKCSHEQVSPTSHEITEETHFLTQQDIMNISVKARLVVLSCCHTGQGEVTSEGVIGITRAFLAAGARSVLATLWPINDDATKEFMEKFYKEFCEETSVCEALRRTKNVFQNHEKNHYQSVKVWAPFTIYGEDVKFKKDEIEKIKEKSRKFFDEFDKSS